MTEVPEHLLEASRKARARLTGKGGDDAAKPASDAGSAVEAAPAAAAPAPVAAAPVPEVPKEPEPVPPFVQAALARKKVPSWAFFIVLMLPIWGFFYVGTTERPPEEGVFEAGEELYSVCANCHGAGGGGGTGRPLAGGEVVATFPDAASHAWWVINGSPAPNTPYGDPNREGGQHVAHDYSGPMAGFATEWTGYEILEVVYYERAEHGELDPDEDHDLLALEELIIHWDDYGLPEKFEPGTEAAVIQAAIDAAIEELGLEDE